MTILTSTQRTLQSDEVLGPKPATSHEAPLFSVGVSVTQLQTVTSSVISPLGGASVTEGTTADSGATYVGTNGGTPMFAIVNPRLPITPPNFANPLAGPASPAGLNVGFNDNGTISQGLIGKL